MAQKYGRSWIQSADELTQKGGGAAKFKQGLGFFSPLLPTTSFQPEASLSLPPHLFSAISSEPPLNKAPKEKAPKQEKNSRNSSRRSRSPDRDKIRDRHSRRCSLSPNRHSKLRSPSRSSDYSRRRHRSWDRQSMRRSRSPEDHG
ncbi:Uncharacterized protein Fot_24835 [Forsythia ovata]|uniref:Uncharacterized protein n=1 Tax=Forsythia ovata TaxID=205694 RepID=A0ABD1U7C3_9LAMI